MTGAAVQNGRRKTKSAALEAIRPGSLGRDETRQNATNYAELRPDQAEALGFLLAGDSITDAAARVGVARQTVHRWLRDDAAFIAAVNSGRRELVEQTQARLVRLADKAVDALEVALDDGDARIALALLRSLGIALPAVAQPGPDAPEKVARAQQLAQRAAMLEDLIASSAW
jgi:hypothetical protein